MENIRKQVREDLEYWSVDDASPEQDEYELGIIQDITEKVLNILKNNNT